jgi:hypothetical protein
MDDKIQSMAGEKPPDIGGGFSGIYGLIQCCS